MENSVQHVSDTAFWVAHHRAMESRRPDALFHDPLAGVLAGGRGAAIAKQMPAARMTAWVVVVRTMMIDDFIREALAGGVDVVCNMGAGLDTRPYRMDLPANLRWVEVDYPHVVQFKEEKLADQKPRCHLERVGVDLTDSRARDEFWQALNASAKKILVLTEGVVPYLDEAQAGELADALARGPKLAGWILDYTSSAWAEMRRRGRLDEKLKHAPLKFRPADFAGFFARHGFVPKEIRYYVAESKKLARSFPVPLWMKLLGAIRGLFLTREKREALSKFGGYALLVPKR